NAAVEWRNSDAAESLQRVHRGRMRTVALDRIERARIQSPTGMENDFAGKFFRPDAGQLRNHRGERVVGRGDQNDAGVQNLAGNRAVGLARTDETRCATRAGVRTSGNGADFPTMFSKTAAERLPYAPSADDCQGPRHWLVE